MGHERLLVRGSHQKLGELDLAVVVHVYLGHDLFHLFSGDLNAKLVVQLLDKLVNLQLTILLHVEAVEDSSQRSALILAEVDCDHLNQSSPLQLVSDPEVHHILEDSEHEAVLDQSFEEVCLSRVDPGSISYLLCSDSLFRLNLYHISH